MFSNSQVERPCSPIDVASDAIDDDFSDSETSNNNQASCCLHVDSTTQGASTTLPSAPPALLLVGWRTPIDQRKLEESYAESDSQFVDYTSLIFNKIFHSFVESPFSWNEAIAAFFHHTRRRRLFVYMFVVAADRHTEELLGYWNVRTKWRSFSLLEATMGCLSTQVEFNAPNFDEGQAFVDNKLNMSRTMRRPRFLLSNGHVEECAPRIRSSARSCAELSAAPPHV